jgi:hypothetical protein
MKARALLTALPLALALLTASQVAHATGHAHNGLFCQPIPFAAGITYSALYGVYNSEAAPATAFCQVQRDQGQTTNNFTRLQAFVYDRHETQNVSCTLRVLDAIGNNRFVSTLSTSGFASPIMVLEWTPSIGLAHDDTITMTCVLPGLTAHGGSHVASYTSFEN